MAPHPPDYHTPKLREEGAENISLRVSLQVSLRDPALRKTVVRIYKHKADNKVAKPFSQTNFGRLPPEIRAKVFTELLATPPPYAGHDFAAEPPETRTSSPAPKKFVHIKASWYPVTRTCRQIYIESHPIFFASKSLYFEKPQDLARFLESKNLVVRQSLQWGSITALWDNITALCLKDFVTCVPLYTKERIDNILSISSTSGNLYITRARLEAMTYKELDLSFGFCFIYLRNIKTIGFCMRVGEELSYVDLLYWVSGMRRGLVEFVDASHWIIRPQNPEDAWSIQYACFSGADFGKGKDNEDIPYARRRIELEVTDIDSRIPGLQEGDERYVEVQIRRSLVESLPQESLDIEEDDTDWKTASSSSEVDLFSRHSDEARLEAPQDQAEDHTLADTSDHEELLREFESDSDGSQFLLDGRGVQTATDGEQEDDHGLIQPAYGNVSATQLSTECDHQAEHPPSSSSAVSITYDASTGAGNDPLSLNSNDEDDEVQTDPTILKHTVHDLQNSDESLAQIKSEADGTQQNLKDEIKGQRRRTKPIYLSRSSKQPLLDIVDTPNPYTEEEMEWYQDWQDREISGTQQRKEKSSCMEEEKPNPPFGKKQKHHVQAPREASKTATPQQERPTTTSQSPPELLIRYLQAGILFLLSLILAISLSDARRDTTVLSQQH